MRVARWQRACPRAACAPRDGGLDARAPCKLTPPNARSLPHQRTLPYSHSSYLVLEFFLFVPLLPVSTTLPGNLLSSRTASGRCGAERRPLCDTRAPNRHAMASMRGRGRDRRNVEVDHCVRRRQSPIRIFAPLEIEGPLGSGKGHPRESVPIANERLAGVEARLQRLDSLPAVCREEQVHGGVICANGARWVRDAPQGSAARLPTRGRDGGSIRPSPSLGLRR